MCWQSTEPCSAAANRLSTSAHGSLYWEGPNQAFNRTGRRHGTTCADPIKFGLEPSYMPVERPSVHRWAVWCVSKRVEDPGQSSETFLMEDC